jgi:hypothetical protein
VQQAQTEMMDVKYCHFLKLLGWYLWILPGPLGEESGELNLALFSYTVWLITHECMGMRVMWSRSRQCLSNNFETGVQQTIVSH